MGPRGEEGDSERAPSTVLLLPVILWAFSGPMLLFSYRSSSFFSLPVRLCPAPRGKCEGEGRRAASKGAPVALCFLFFLCLFFFGGGASLCKADAYVFCVLFRFRSLQIALCPAPRRRRQGTKGKHANFKGNDFLFFLGWSCVKFAAHPLVFRCCCFYGLLCPSSSGPSLHK